jgi:hypothetical protein
MYLRLGFEDTGIPAAVVSPEQVFRDRCFGKPKGRKCYAGDAKGVFWRHNSGRHNDFPYFSLKNQVDELGQFYLM